MTHEWTCGFSLCGPNPSPSQPSQELTSLSSYTSPDTHKHTGNIDAFTNMPLTKLDVSYCGNLQGE